MAINISFGGVNIERPGAYSLVDTSAMIPILAGDFKTLAVVGLPGASNSVYATKQVIQCTVVGSVNTEGTASVVLTARGLSASSKTIAVPVLAADTAISVASKVATALNSDTDFSAIMTAASSNATVTITAKVADVNDPTMSITVGNGTCLGLTSATSTITTVGVKGGVVYFDDPEVAAATIGASESLDLMNVSWSTGANLFAYSPVALTAADADWQAAIDALESEPVDGILIASNSSVIGAKALAHCQSMSSILNRRERRCFLGHAAGITGPVSNLATLQSFNDELATMATPAVYFTDSNGNKVLKGSEYLAAAYAGMWASSAAQEPLTYRYVSVFPGLERVYKGTEVIDLLKAGLAPLEYVNKKGYRIVQGVTTANGVSKDVTECELSVSTCKVQMNKEMRDYMEDKYVGQAGVAGVEVTMYNDAITLIEGFIRAGYASAYDKTAVKVVRNSTDSGAVFAIRWKGTPTLPINDFLITTQFTI